MHRCRVPGQRRLTFDVLQKIMRNPNPLPAVFLVIVAIVIIPLWMWLYPKYRVYNQEMRGSADLKEASINKKILVEDAIAKEEAAIMQAKARITLAEAENKSLKLRADGEAERELIRAKATAEAIKIIGTQPEGNEEYIRYLWIMNISEGGERIYIPTEAGLPILEANPKLSIPRNKK